MTASYISFVNECLVQRFRMMRRMVSNDLSNVYRFICIDIPVNEFSNECLFALMTLSAGQAEMAATWIVAILAQDSP